MKNYDLIQELRDKAPDRDKAVRLMVEVGGICLFVALWNVAMSFFNSEFSHEFYGLTYFCTGFFVTGFLFLVSAYGLRRRASWGKKISQLSIAVFAFMMLMSVFLIGKSWFNFSGNFGKDSLGDFFSVFKFLMFIILSVIFLARVLIPAYYSLHYLNRLESGGDSSLNEKKVSRIFLTMPKTQSRFPKMGLKLQKIR